VHCNFFHLQTLLAVPARNWRNLDTLLAILERMDQALFRAVPFTRRYAWVTGLTLAQPHQ